MLKLGGRTEYPTGKHDIITKVVDYDSEKILSLIHYCVDNNRQVFIVCPKINMGTCNDSSVDIYEKFEPLFKEKIALLHGKISSKEKIEILEKFIPILDNWAVCDSFCSDAKWMKQAEKDILWDFLQHRFDSKREFEVRFAIVTSMCYFINDEWIERVFQKIDKIDFDSIKSEYKRVKGKPHTAQEGTVQGVEPYYVRMGVAWLLATTLAKYPEKTREYIHASHLPQDVIKLYIRKAKESFRTRDVEALAVPAVQD